MKFNRDFLTRYIALAPVPLAVERSIECEILSKQEFRQPILDVGCGEGLFAHVLFAEKVAVGVDPNQNELNRARELGGYERLLCCTGDSIDVPDSYFATVFSNSVMEHIPDLAPVLDECFRVLQPGGNLYITVPSARFDEFSVLSQFLGAIKAKSAQTKYRQFYNRFWRHYHYASPESWGATIRSHGFVIVEARSYCPKHVCLFNDLMVPISLPSFIIKKLFNRWTLLPDIRRALLAPVTAIARATTRDAEHNSNGGLVFIAARKPN